MKRILSVAALAALMSAPLVSPAAQAVEIEVAYPYSNSFDITFEKIMESFRKDHPEIDVRFRATYEHYEDGTNTVLREAVSGNLPDVTMQGLNRQAILVEKGIAKPLTPFIAKEAQFETDGYHKAMLELSTFDGAVYGLPFAVSTPIGYYNMDILKEAGVETLPTTWDEVAAVCEKVKAIGKDPVFWGWNITGNWFFQSLMWSQGEPMIKNGKINFDGGAGLKALETMKTIFRSCEMKNLSVNESAQSFATGELAMYFWSTSSVSQIERTKAGAWTFKTAPFPGMDGKPMALPAGGNSAMFVSTSEDPERRQAAWTFLKYITSGVGAAAVAETTGYIPPNKAANEIILADFYQRNPNKEAAVKQLPLLSESFAYPGENGLAITQVIFDSIERIVVGDADDMAKLQQEMVEEVRELVPAGS
jgi:multiple sugar transport system substrate-binding protein